MEEIEGLLDPLELVSTQNTSALLWARAFVQRFPEVKEHEASISTWFAAAMMAMYDKARVPR